LKYLSTQLLEVGQLLNKKEDLSFYNNIFFKTTNNNINVYDFNDSSRFIKRTQGVTLPLRFIKTLTDYNTNSYDIFNIQYNENTSTISSKIKPYTNSLILKQKRYKRKKIITPINYTTKDLKVS